VTIECFIEKVVVLVVVQAFVINRRSALVSKFTHLTLSNVIKVLVSVLVSFDLYLLSRNLVLAVLFRGL